MSAMSESLLVADYLRGRAANQIALVEGEKAAEAAWLAAATAPKPEKPKPRVHIVRCTRLAGGWQTCCLSCHEDEDLGYETLYWDDHEVPGRTDFELGEYSCCGKHGAVKARIERMVARLMPRTPCGCACNCHAEESRPYWPGPCAGCCDPHVEPYECVCTARLREAWGWTDEVV